MALRSLFTGKNIDFFVCCSSLSASLAQFGQVAYVASNIFLDAFSQYASETCPVISIEWPALREVGMAVSAIRHLSHEEQEHILENAITPSEAIAVLVSALKTKIPVQIVSPVDLKTRIYNHNKAWQEFGEVQDLPFVASGRNNLSSVYAAASTATEQDLVRLIETFFGVKGIGIEDDFFELGGDSLKAMVFLRRVKKEMQVDVPLKDFFENPTIKYTSACIDEVRNLIQRKSDASWETIRI
jgi:acyl carrier protein